MQEKKQPIRKKELMKLTQELCKYHKYEVEDVMNAFFYILEERIEQGDTVMFEGIGKFQTMLSKGRTIVNPRTGVFEDYPDQPKIKFTVSPILLSRVRNDYMSNK